MNERYLINNICEVGSSKRIYLSEYQDSGVPFYRGKEIIEKDSNKDISNELFISQERYDEIKTKFGVPAVGDILMTAVGTIGISWYVNETNFYFKDGNLIWFKNFNKDIINSKYLYYLFKSKLFSEIIKNISIGSTQKAITIEQVKKIELNLPKIEIQTKIVKMLDNIDRKIKLNNEINNNLYEEAVALFDNIFPGIQKGNKTIGEYLVPKRGKNLLSRDAKYGNIPVIAGGLYPATYHNQPNTHFPVITISASGANAGYTNLWEVPVWASDCSYIDDTITNNIYFWYIVLKTRQKEIFDAQTGSAQPHIYPQHIAEMPICELKCDKVKEYNTLVEPLFKMIGNNIAENEQLLKLRDTLLPKLMNGEIDLDNIKI